MRTVNTFVALSMLLPAMAAMGQQKQPGIRFGANALTHPYIRDTIGHNIGFDNIRGNAVRTLPDAEVLRLLREGKLDAGSVFFPIGPAANEGRTSTQPDEMSKLLPKDAIVHSVGRLGAWVLVPAGRNLPRLTVDQLADILSGKITKWEQLSAGTGNLVIAYDDASLAAACTAAGIAQPRVSDSSRWVKDPANGRLTLNRMVGDAMAAEQDRLSKQPARAGATDNYLLIASSVQVLQADQGRVKLKRFVPIAPSADKPAVTPDLKTVGDGSYPLLVDWRIVVRPDATETAQGAAKLCLRSYETGLVNAYYVKEWLIQPARGEQPDVIRVFYYGGQDAIEAAATAYIKTNPQARFANVSGVDRPVADIFARNADLLVVVGYLFSDQRKKLSELCGGEVAELAVGRRPVLIVASQECPVTSLTLEQARHVASYDLTEWKDLGWDCGQGVVKHALGSKLLADAMFGGYGNMKRHPIITSPSAKRGAAGAAPSVRDLAKMNYGSEAQLLSAVSADKYSLGFVAAGKSSLGSGLKVLKVGLGSSSAVGPEAANVVSGAYPVALPVSVLVHPKAGPAAKKFASWLQSPQAAEALATHYIYSKALMLKPPAGVTAATTAAPPDVKAFTGQVSGAAAVLPVEVLSLYFLMAKSEHLAAYEDAICKVIDADGRLKVVDRAHLDKVWRERLYAVLSGQTEFKPAISADVFAAPAIVPAGAGSALRIRFLHGPTASVLGELSLPINPSDPVRFDPPLEQALRPVWQGVLASLTHARSRPRWAMVGVYSATETGMGQAAQIEQRIRDTLRGDKRLFFCETLDVDAAQQEVLMAMMGAGRPTVGGFRGDSDFLLEGKLQDGQLELRVLDGGNLAPLARESFEPGADEPIRQWLSTQAQREKGAGSAATAAPADNWSGRQARLEFEIAQRLGKEIDARTREAQQRRVKAGLTKIMDDDAQVLKDLAEQRRRHLTRAVQLDPDDEEICQAFIGAVEDGSSRFPVYVRKAQMCERVVRLFPKSAQHRGNMEYAITYYATAAHFLGKSLRGADSLAVPRGIDHPRLRLFYLKKELSLFDSYAARYAGCFDDPKEDRGSWHTFGNYMLQYLYAAGCYVYLGKPAAQEVDQMIARWSAIFDDKPAAGPHSDFLRLRLIALKNDCVGFLKLLTDMQRLHPDPKDKYWLIGAHVVQEDMYRLFGHGTARCNFAKWRDGSRGIGGLPYDGYDPAKDTSEPAAINIE